MKIKKYVTLACVAFLFAGCSLNFDESNGDTKEIAYSYYDNLVKLVSYVYSFLPTDLDRNSGAMVESATDNSVYSWENNSIYNICNDVWSPIVTMDTGWDYFDAIRSANSFLENFDIEALKEFEFNDNYDAIMAKAKLFPSEVRFLRVFYFFELCKRYGNIPMLTRTYEPEEINSVTPSSFEDVIGFIVTECDQIADQLPVDHRVYQGETGRATKGAVLALKSRALLYAASPLHNPTNDKSKWEKAAKAAAEVIKMGQYSLPKITDDQLYTGNGNDVLSSPQLIFERRNGNQTSTFEARNEPMGYEGSQGGNTPTQNLVDAYEMKNGTPFDWNNTQHVQEIYVDASGHPTRDPRLYLNVLHNGATWLKQKVETNVGGLHTGMNGGTKTGYYLRKYMNPLVSLDPVKPLKKEHHYPLFRYAEVLLNYAEAMYGWVGEDVKPSDYPYPLSAREALNLVRDCADMKHVEETGEAFLEKVRNERRIELAFEDHRFWDIRRWKTGEVVKNIYGVQITGSGSSFTYQKVLVEQRKWDDKMYLFPIPQKEIDMNVNLEQNPGW